MEKEVQLAIKDDYVRGFMSNASLAKKYNIHRKTVKECLKAQGVALRKRTPQTPVDHFFFAKYNAESCYWAGFILADGYIRNNKRFLTEIKLQKRDELHLRKFKKAIGFLGDIKERTNYFSISISSSQIVSDLANKFEIHNNKSLTCHISSKVPIRYLRDYIRGYFDGDGCITGALSRPIISFTGTRATSTFIRDYFYNVCNIKLRSKDKPDIIKWNTNKVSVINYSGIAAFRCLDHMYHGSKNFLDRKRDKYLALIPQYRS